MSLRPLPIVLSVLLVASCLSLVTSQHRARGLFIDLEAAQAEARQLEADRERLRIALGRSSQPAVVEQAAISLGLGPATVARTVLLPGEAGLRGTDDMALARNDGRSRR